MRTSSRHDTSHRARTRVELSIQSFIMNFPSPHGGIITPEETSRRLRRGRTPSCRRHARRRDRRLFFLQSRDTLATSPFPKPPPPQDRCAVFPSPLQHIFPSIIACSSISSPLPSPFLPYHWERPSLSLRILPLTPLSSPPPFMPVCRLPSPYLNSRLTSKPPLAARSSS